MKRTEQRAQPKPHIYNTPSTQTAKHMVRNQSKLHILAKSHQKTPTIMRLSVANGASRPPKSHEGNTAIVQHGLLAKPNKSMYHTTFKRANESRISCVPWLDVETEVKVGTRNSPYFEVGPKYGEKDSCVCVCNCRLTQSKGGQCSLLWHLYPHPHQKSMSNTP